MQSSPHCWDSVWSRFFDLSFHDGEKGGENVWGPSETSFFRLSLVGTGVRRLGTPFLLSGSYTLKHKYHHSYLIPSTLKSLLLPIETSPLEARRRSSFSLSFPPKLRLLLLPCLRVFTWRVKMYKIKNNVLVTIYVPFFKFTKFICMLFRFFGESWRLTISDQVSLWTQSETWSETQGWRWRGTGQDVKSSLEKTIPYMDRSLYTYKCSYTHIFLRRVLWCSLYYEIINIFQDINDKKLIDIERHNRVDLEIIVESRGL